MSSYKGDNHLEHPRTETSDSTESTLSGTAHGVRSGRAAQPVRTTGETTVRSVSKGGRLLAELEITSIAARSPQAKGRVERLFGTDA
jgi:hypothetical protein